MQRAKRLPHSESWRQRKPQLSSTALPWHVAAADAHVGAGGHARQQAAGVGGVVGEGHRYGSGTSFTVPCGASGVVCACCFLPAPQPRPQHLVERLGDLGTGSVFSTRRLLRSQSRCGCCGAGLGAGDHLAQHARRESRAQAGVGGSCDHACTTNRPTSPWISVATSILILIVARSHPDCRATADRRHCGGACSGRRITCHDCLARGLLRRSACSCRCDWTLRLIASVSAGRSRRIRRALSR